MSDQKRFDILGAVLHDREQTPPEVKTIEKMLRRQRETLSIEDLADQQPDPWLAKVKTTYYLGEEVYKNLEDSRQAIADMLPQAIRHRVTRSLLVELAIKLVLRDFEKKGRGSALCQLLFRGISRPGKR